LFEGVTRQILEEAQQVNDLVALIALERSDRVAAIAEHH
jgi:hypothetical protein